MNFDPHKVISSEIKIERRDDGGYDAWRVDDLECGKSVYNRIDTSKISEPVPYGQSVESWANGLTSDELEVGIAIFTERWMFDSGREEDRICLEALEEERKWRETPKHDHSIPPHTHTLAVTGSIPPQNPIAGQLWHNDATGQMEVFDGHHWHPVNVGVHATTTSVAGPPGNEHCHAVTPQFTILPAGGNSTP